MHKDKDRTRTKTKFTQCDDNKKRQRHHLEGKQTNAKLIKDALTDRIERLTRYRQTVKNKFQIRQIH